jgi:hypothetical protein
MTLRCNRAGRVSSKFNVILLYFAGAARTSTAEADRDRLEQERQEAVESLQLKKFNHRKKFQRALFESK